MNPVWVLKTREAIFQLYIALASQLELLVHHCTCLATTQFSLQQPAWCCVLDLWLKQCWKHTDVLATADCHGFLFLTLPSPDSDY